MSEFAANCPEKCPPPDADGVHGEIYRFVRHNPPTHADMRSYADEGRYPDHRDVCGRCALSVLARAGDISSARKAIPFFRKLQIAKATLRPEHGKSCQSGNHAWHYSLWVKAMYIATIHQEFSVVPE